MSSETIIINLDIDDDNGQTLPPQYPTPEQIFFLWDNYFEPLLKSSDNHNAQLLQEFENDILQYVKTKTIEI